VGLLAEASGRCVVVRPRRDADAARNFSKSQKFTGSCAPARDSSRKKIIFRGTNDLLLVLGNYKVSLSGLDLFRRSFSGGMFSSVKLDIRSRLFGLSGTRILSWGAGFGESGGGESTTQVGSGRKSSGC